jgi:hypothetical protein
MTIDKLWESFMNSHLDSEEQQLAEQLKGLVERFKV